MPSCSSSPATKAPTKPVPPVTKVAWGRAADGLGLRAVTLSNVKLGLFNIIEEVVSRYESCRSLIGSMAFAPGLTKSGAELANVSHPIHGRHTEKLEVTIEY